MSILKEKQYFPSIDLLRGVASVSVCLFHFVIISRFSYPSIFRDIFSYGHFGVQVFFVVSGFVIPYSMYRGKYTLKKAKIFFAKRLIRLEPPYIVSIILIILLNLFLYFSPFYNEELLDISFKQLLYHFGYLNSIFQEGWLNEVYWSLGIEFQYYILMALIFKYIISKRITWIIVFFTFALLSIIIPRHSFIFSHLPFFVIGILIFRYLTKKDSFSVLIVFYLATLLLILFNSGWDFVYLIVGLFPLPFFFFQRASRIGKFLGNISYSLYLIHIPIGQRIIRIGIDFTGNIYEETALIVVTLAFSLFFSYIFFILIERPSKRWTYRFKYLNNN